MILNTIEALNERKSVREFLEKSVSKELIEKILNAAKHSPSGKNTQPWKVAVISGETKKKLDAQLSERFLNEMTTKGTYTSNMDYSYDTERASIPREFTKRVIACGLQMYSALNIDKANKPARLEQWCKNYTSFNAPVSLIIMMNKNLEKGSYMDCGMFIQSIMLAATSLGLATCPQASMAEQPQIIREVLGLDDTDMVLCGIALGYEKKDAVINSYRTPREELSEFVRFFD